MGSELYCFTRQLDYVRYGEWMRARTQMQGGKGICINNNIHKANKNYRLAGQGRTGQDRTGQDTM